MKDAETWVITDGKTGMVSQATGLAEAVGLRVVRKTVVASRPWRWLPPNFWPPGVSGIGRGSDALDGAAPALLISCGRHAIGPALWIKARHHGGPFVVHVQHPRLDPSRFDLIAAPIHDGLTGANVIPIIGSLHGVTQEKLSAAAARFSSLADRLPRPLVAVLVGGSNRSYQLTDAAVDTLADQLVTLCRSHGAGLAVTPSRRTGAAAERRLRDRLGDVPAEIWDGSGENPYLGYLALADAIVVTCDSVNMISEACATGKPVYIAALDGGGSNKFDAFRSTLSEAGMVRPFTGRFETWTYEPLNETERIAGEIRRRMRLST